MLQQKQKSTKGMSKYLLAIPALAVSVLMLSAGNAPQNNLSENLPKISVAEAQLTNSQVVNDTLPFTKVDKTPRFKECENVSESENLDCFRKKMDAHIARNFKYPEAALKNNLQGKVTVVFVIGAEGKVVVKSLKGGDKLLQEEAKRLIEMLPELIPAKHKGKNIAVNFVYPISFKLSK